MNNAAVVAGLLAIICCGQSQGATFTLEEATVEHINNAFDTGLLSSERLVQLYLNRIEAYDQQGPTINSIIMINPNALKTARELDMERQTIGARSRLHGIPILLKDSLDTVDMPTTSGSIALRDSIPPDDAFIVKKLRDAGAIILGKTNLDEFACCSITLSSLGGQTKNPYRLTHVPGGSSGGTAAAIAANFAVIGTGADGWGSIQEPSSLNSLVGVIPTRSLVSGDGTIPPPSVRRGVTGPIARTVADAVAMLDIIAGPDSADPVTAASEGRVPDSYFEFLDENGLNGARIGLVSNFLSGARQDVRDLTMASAARMQSLGAEVIDVNLASPRNSDTFYFDLEYGINRYLESLGPDARFASLQEIIASGEYLPSLDDLAFDYLRGDIAPEQDPAYARVVDVRNAFEQHVIGLMASENLDALVYPPLLSHPATISSAQGSGGIWESEADFRNMNPSPFLGFPSITVPAGFDGSGLPVGIEFLGQPFSEPTLIRLAYAFEQATRHRVSPATTPPLAGETIPAAGDFNRDDVLDVADLDALIAEILAGTNDPQFDLDGNGSVDTDDRDFWISDIKTTFFGDTNLDGKVNAVDLNTLALSWRRTDATSWAQGDFNGDGNVNAADLNDLALNWRSGVVPAAPAAPEPLSITLLLLAGFYLLRTRG